MPESIVTSLLLWLALLLPGAKADSSQALPVSQASRPVQLVALHIPTIQSWPLDQESPWTVSEADTNEEESGEDDAERIVTETRWPSPALGQHGQSFSFRIEPGIVRSSTRSPLLRC